MAGAVGDLIREGEIKHFGLCEGGAATIQRIHGVQPVTALQSEYFLWARDPEENTVPTLEALDIGFVSFSPRGRGFLTGKMDETMQFGSADLRNSLPRFAAEARKANLALVALLARVAKQRGTSPA